MPRSYPRGQPTVPFSLSFGPWCSPVARPIAVPRAASTPKVAARSARRGRASSSGSCARRWRRARSTSCRTRASACRWRTTRPPATGRWPTACSATPAPRRRGSRPTRRSGGCSIVGTRSWRVPPARECQPARPGRARSRGHRDQRRDRPPQCRGPDRSPASPPARRRRGARPPRRIATPGDRPRDRRPSRRSACAARRPRTRRPSGGSRTTRGGRRTGACCATRRSNGSWSAPTPRIASTSASSATRRGSGRRTASRRCSRRPRSSPTG